MNEPKKGPVTRTGASTATTIRVRGRDMVNELIGNYSFTEMLYFLTCGKFPSRQQTKVLDACLVTLMEHGLTPSAVIARLMADSVPEEPQVAIASGLLAIGSVYAGTTESCAALLLAIEHRIKAGESGAIAALVQEHAKAKRPVAGFGHGTHKPDDPRTARLFEIARNEGLGGGYVALLVELGEQVDKTFGRHITINATGAIGALLLEIGVPVSAMRAYSIVSRAGGLEEHETHSGRTIWAAAKAGIPYVEEP
ncbi:MAG: citryl-CoA lyase [Rhizobiales bacterium]|nr:citryl-CoA lyase [Hyphomicrobiales bacterium]